MGWKSTSETYGRVAVLLHWVSAALIIGLLIAGFLASATTDDSAKITVLSLHAPIGTAVLVLTIARLAWWLFADRKPAEPPGTPRWQALTAKAVHGGLMLVIPGLAISGIALFALSGAGDIVFGGKAGPLPDFWDFAPRYGHAVLARLAVLLLALHVGAALFHQFVRRDHILRRMGIGR